MLSSLRRIDSMWILLVALTLSIALVPVIALRYAYNALSRQMSLIGFVILLVLTPGLWVYAGRPSRRGLSPAIQDRVGIGLWLGAVWTIEISFNNLLAPPVPGRDHVDNIFWVFIALSILVYASIGACRSGRLRTGLTLGWWSGLASGAIACWTALGYIVFGMRFLLHDPVNQAEWMDRGPSSGTSSMAAYFAYQTFAGAFLHLIVLGVIMGALLGLLGGLLGNSFRFLKRPSSGA